MRSLVARLAGFLTRRRDDEALDEEIAVHLDLLAAEYERNGMPAHDAERAARRAFGGVQPMKERYRDQRGFRWVDNVVRDVKYGWRTIVRSPACATAVIAILAVGIGANAAVFSLLDAAMFRALPVTASEGLVAVESDSLIPLSGVSGAERLPASARRRAGDHGPAACRPALDGRHATEHLRHGSLERLLFHHRREPCGRQAVPA